MKAFETRKASVKPQYDSAMKEISQAMNWGWKRTHVGNGTLYPEVAEMIAKDGFDIKIVKRADDTMSYNEISWENAEEGKEGTITYVDETQLKLDPADIPDPADILDPADIFVRILGLKREEATESKEDEHPNNEENKTDSEAEE